MNDITSFAVRPEHAVKAIEMCSADPLPEGNVGAGSGMICHRFKVHAQHSWANDRVGQDRVQDLFLKTINRPRIGLSGQSSKRTTAQFKIYIYVEFPSDSYGSKTTRLQKRISLKMEV